jgi:hypothetical protein
LLEGKNVNLRIAEKEDLPLIAEWLNNPGFFSYAPFPQRSKAELANQYDKLASESMWFIAEKKDRSKIGFLYHSLERNLLEIGYAVVPGERRKGYGTEAVGLMVDYLFLALRIVRIQATTDVETSRHRESWRRTVSRERELFARSASPGDDGETNTCTAFSEKSGRNKGYSQEPRQQHQRRRF